MGLFDRIFSGHHRGGGQHSRGHGDRHYPPEPDRSRDRGQACAKCRAVSASNAQFCQQCGAGLTAKRCNSCGSDVSAGANFCANCGKSAA